jgi:hypothetical protein
MMDIAHTLNPAIHTIALARNNEEVDLLKTQAGQVFIAEQELALAMMRQVLARIERNKP